MAGPAHSTRPARRLPVLASPDRLELQVWVQMVRSFNHITRRLGQVLDKHGLSLAQADVLFSLAAEEGITQQELAGRLLVTKGNVCAILGRMEAHGWVERRSDPLDRRANRLHLTRAGKSILGRVLPEHQVALRESMAALTAVQQQTLHQLLDRLEDGTEGEG